MGSLVGAEDIKHDGLGVVEIITIFASQEDFCILWDNTIWQVTVDR